MKAINKDSQVSLALKVAWETKQAHHEDEVFVGNVNIWRDILPPQLESALLGKSRGDQVKLELQPGEVVPDYDARLIKELKKAQVNSPGNNGHGIQGGRFYPQGLIQGVGGIYPQNIAPFRVSRINGKVLEADFNHPLAGKPLELTATVEEVYSKKSERGGGCANVEDMLGTGPGMQAPMDSAPTGFLYEGALEREDNSPDSVFYEKPRMVHHLDEAARGVISELYGELLEDGMEVLDFMSSWTSHLPKKRLLRYVHGLGMNGAELAANPALSAHTVWDVNESPLLPFGNDSFDAVISTVSVEYLTRPLEVMKELHRVLRPGGLLVFTFSNRWFPPKVVKVWTELHEFERMGLVMDYFTRAGGFTDLHTRSFRGLPRPDGDKYAKQLACSDPVYAVWGYKQ